MDVKSKIFLSVFFLAIIYSIALTYYHTVILQDYVVFTDPNEVPDPTDFVANLKNLFQK